MKIVMFYHSLVSNRSLGNPHALRGLVCELRPAKHQVMVYEPETGWRPLLSELGKEGQAALHRAHPDRVRSLYVVHSRDLERLLDKAELVIVHPGIDPALLRRIGRHRGRWEAVDAKVFRLSRTDRSGGLPS